MIGTTRKIPLILALVLLGASFAFTQSAPAASTPAASGGNADARIFAVDLGMIAGYNLGTNAATVGRSFGLNIIVADNLAVGIYNTIAGATYNFLRVGYNLTPALGFNLYVGNNGASTAGGLGASFALFKSRTDAGLASALKSKFEYLFDTGAGLAKGDIVLSVSTSLGM
jgi:hypothetical protein